MTEDVQMKDANAEPEKKEETTDKKEPVDQFFGKLFYCITQTLCLRAEKGVDFDGEGSQREGFQNLRLINQVIQKAPQTLFPQRCRPRAKVLPRGPLHQTETSCGADGGEGQREDRGEAPLHDRESS